MEINLLPQVPTTKKFLWPIALIVGSIVIVFSSIVGLHIWSKTIQLASQKQVLEQFKKERQASTNQLNRMRQDLELPTLYLESIKKLDLAHTNWVSLIDEISKKLPEDGQITSMNWTSNGVLEIKGSFPSLERVGQYIQWLNQIDWIEETHFMVGEAQVQGTNIQEMIPQETAIDGYQITIQLKLNLPSLNVKEEIAK